MKKAYTIQVTQAHSGTFKVSMSDHNGNSNTVYERSVDDALKYAKHGVKKQKSVNTLKM